MLPVDMVTTLLVAQKYGIADEANPIIKWALQQGLFAFTVVNLIATVLATLLFVLFIHIIEEAEGKPRYILSRMYGGWTISLTILGIFIAVSNLSYYFAGETLITAETIQSIMTIIPF